MGIRIYVQWHNAICQGQIALMQLKSLKHILYATVILNKMNASGMVLFYLLLYVLRFKCIVLFVLRV